MSVIWVFLCFNLPQYVLIWCTLERFGLALANLQLSVSKNWIIIRTSHDSVMLSWVDAATTCTYHIFRSIPLSLLLDTNWKFNYRKNPKYNQPSRPNQRSPSRNQEIMLICDLTPLHVTTKLLPVTIRPWLQHHSIHLLENGILIELPSMYPIGHQDDEYYIICCSQGQAQLSNVQSMPSRPHFASSNRRLTYKETRRQYVLCALSDRKARCIY